MTNEPIPAASRLASAPARPVLVGLGHLCIVLAVIGAILPVMPTTVFVIAAAWCYARGSPRFHRWLAANPVFGPVVRNWETNRAMSRQAKVLAIGMIVATFSLTIGFAIHQPWLKLGLAVLGASLIGLILWIKTAE
jgi:uncharacterized membrane protein YbaN (DUF454 family)